MAHNTSDKNGGYYKIHLEGRIDPSWHGWLAGLNVSPGDSETLVFAELPDQAALHGLLKHIRDSGLTLIRIQRL